MELDEDKIDDAVLALLRLTLHDERRAWKGFDWDALERRLWTPRAGAETASRSALLRL